MSFDNPLNNVRIASPCPANWNEMYGDERVRFCGQCKLNVYNLSGMTTYDAENLFRLSEGRLCVRYYQRADGTIITKDCPVGWARTKERISLWAAAVFSVIVSIFGGLFVISTLARRPAAVGKIVIPMGSPTPEPLMGAVAIDPPRTTRKTQNSRL